MKIQMLIFGLLCSAQALGATGWVPVSDSAGVNYFAKSASIKPETNAVGIIDITVKANFAAPQTASYNASLSYRSTVTMYQIDCANNFISVQNVAYYADDATRGKALKQYTFSKAKQLDIVPWSPFDDFKKYACKNLAGSAKEPALEDMKPTVIHDTRKSVFSPGAK
ncbi:MAG: surface-adhesin E family protein [Paralcaligenes sp.]